MMPKSEENTSRNRSDSICAPPPPQPAELENQLREERRVRLSHAEQALEFEKALFRANEMRIGDTSRQFAAPRQNLCKRLTKAVQTFFDLSPPSSKLAEMGIVVVPDPNDFPGMAPTDLPNYASIVRGFSRCFSPTLFDELGIPDPYAAWPYEQTYWDTLFARIQPGGFRVRVLKSTSPVCFGESGATDGHSYINLYDCSSERDVLHEAAHVIMEAGILGGLRPVYYQFATGRPGQVLDAQADLHRLFGHSEARIDFVDGAAYGLVSTYAATSQKEDFAETLSYFVYEPSTVWSKVARQQANGSRLLGDKINYVAFLYHTLSFKNGGVVDSWQGYPI